MYLNRKEIKRSYICIYIYIYWSKWSWNNDQMFLRIITVSNIQNASERRRLLPFSPFWSKFLFTSPNLLLLSLYMYQELKGQGRIHRCGRGNTKVKKHGIASRSQRTHDEDQDRNRNNFGRDYHPRWGSQTKPGLLSPFCPNFSLPSCWVCLFVLLFFSFYFWFFSLSIEIGKRNKPAFTKNRKALKNCIMVPLSMQIWTGLLDFDKLQIDLWIFKIAK